MNVDWLTKRVTREELLADENGSTRWRELLDEHQEGDELWEFNSPAHYWRNLAGRCGVCLVRDEKIVASVVTIMN